MLHETGALADAAYSALVQAVGFHNAMLDDYMNFKPEILLQALKDARYRDLSAFLVAPAEYPAVVLERLRSFRP